MSPQFQQRNRWVQGSGNVPWQGNPMDDPARYQDLNEFMDGKRRPPSKEDLRLMHVAVKPEPGQSDFQANGWTFRCPACEVRFRIEYGIFGKLAWLNSPFGQSQYWCRDCADLNNIIRIDKRRA